MCAACGSDCALWYPLKILPFFFLFSNLRLDFDTAPFFTKGRRRGRTTSLSRIAWSLLRASDPTAVPTHVPSPHELGACDYIVFVIQLHLRRSTAPRTCAWTAPMAAPCRRRSRQQHDLQCITHVLQGALVRRADRHDQCRLRGGRSQKRQPPDRPRAARDQLLQTSERRLQRPPAHVWGPRPGSMPGLGLEVK